MRHWVRKLFSILAEYTILAWNTSCWRCHISCSSFISIGTLWPPLQTKKLKGICLHSWPQISYKAHRFGTHTDITSVLTPTDFRHAWVILAFWRTKNSWKGELSSAELLASTKFPRLFYMFCDQFETRFMHLVDGTGHLFNHLDLVYELDIVENNICYFLSCVYR